MMSTKGATGPCPHMYGPLGPLGTLARPKGAKGAKDSVLAAVALLPHEEDHDE
jgi:hypothetical protein